MKLLKSALLAGAVLAASAGGTWAQQTLKLVHPWAATHYLYEQGGKVFTDEVKRLSGGKIDFQVYPAGQLGKDYFTILKTNIADLAIIATSTFSTEKFPLTSVTELPGLYASACEGTHKFWELAKDGGVLADNEYGPQDLHILYVTVLAPYAMMTAKTPLNTLQDMAGLKIRGNGAAQERIISALGGVPVKIGSTELYDALSRGTVDGALFPFSGLPPYDMQNVLHHAALGPQLGAGATVFAVSKSKWESFDAETRKIMEQAAAKAQENVCKFLDDDDAVIQKNVSEKDGFKLNKLSAEEIARWHERIASVTTEWSKQMDGSGRKGTETLEAFKAAKP